MILSVFQKVLMIHTSEQKADPAQETAIRHGAGPCAVIAGPGSGKTFVLVERIRYLIDTGNADPSSILVLTFSRAAAAHMRRRFLNSCAHAETVFGTFHSVFFKILQESSAEPLSLIAAGAKRDYLRHLCRLKPGFLPEKTTAEELQLLISRFKNGLSCRQEWVAELVSTYDNYLRGRGWLDFDDMILRCKELLHEDKAVLSLWQQRFRWILVDEFQDVSPCQYEVLRLLAAPLDNLFIVGDDDQSIYGFRGADPLMMQRFLRDYILDRDDAQDRMLFLTTNYRCGERILQASVSEIRCNRHRIDKDFRTGTGEQGIFSCRPFSDRNLQYHFIAGELKMMTPAERERTAVFFRTHGAAGQFLKVLQEQAVPYLAEGIGRTAQKTEDSTRVLQDLIAYYRASAVLESGGICRDQTSTAVRSTFHEDLLRIMNRPERFLSGSFAASGCMGREDLLAHAGFDRSAVEDLIGDLELLNTLSPEYSLRYLLDSVGYRDYAHSVYREIPDFLNTLQKESKNFVSSRKWIAFLEKQRNESLREPQDDRRGNGPAVSAGAVRVLTMHACKGLEFDRVFIPDLNEGSLPSKRAWTPEQIEEERRLFYVAMTRARLALTLTYLEGTADRPAAPSRFLQPFRGNMGFRLPVSDF